MSDQKEIFQEEVEEAVTLLKKKISKKRGGLDRHIIKVESELESMEEERDMLIKLSEMTPARQPILIKAVSEEEK